MVGRHRSFIQDKVAKRWFPDDVVFLEGDPEDERRQVLEEGAPRPVRALQAANHMTGNVDA
jgi:hypothetical protein